MGLDVFDGKVKNMLNEDLIEPLKVKTQAIDSASEVLVMILRIDDVITASELGKEKGGMPPM